MPSRLSGIGLMGIQEKVLDLHVRAWNEDFVALPVGGFFRYSRGGVSHAWEAGLIHTLQHAVATDSYMTYRNFPEGVHDQPPNILPDLLDFNVDGVNAVLIGPVGWTTAIHHRLLTVALWLGPLYPETNDPRDNPI